jgi:alkaline phosphatase D
MKYFVLLSLAIVMSACKKQEVVTREHSGELVASIAFGSCNKQDQSQVLWDDVVKNEPDMWIWLGDNIYGDTSDPGIMKGKYDRQKSNTDYQNLLSNTQIYGVWDDHDYGKNDGGKEFPAKDTMRDLMFDFLDVSKDSPAWQRKGGYQSYDLLINDLEIKLILLDSRYFRDEAPKSNGIYVPNLDGTILGRDQWTWLEDELSNLQCDILIIGNGIQVLPEEHRYEKWANFPNERKRLLEMLSQKNLPTTLLLSGDRHLTEVSRIKLEKVIYEVTCSGMTHTYSGLVSESNKHRVGQVITKKNYGLLKVYDNGGKKELVFEARGDDQAIFQEIELSY